MRSVLAGVLAMGLAACHSHDVFRIDGTWRGGYTGEHSAYYVMTLQQQGDQVSGVLCRISSLHRIFFDLPVHGRYPRVEADLAYGRFEGGIVSDDQIHGLFRLSGGFQQEWWFQRVPASEYEQCRNASP